LNLTTQQLNILCTSAVKRCYAKNNNSPSSSLVYAYRSSLKQKKLAKLPPSSVELNLVNLLLWRVLELK